MYFCVCADYRELGPLAFPVSCRWYFDVCALAEGYLELGAVLLSTWSKALVPSFLGDKIDTTAPVHVIFIGFSFPHLTIARSL